MAYPTSPRKKPGGWRSAIRFRSISGSAGAICGILALASSAGASNGNLPELSLTPIPGGKLATPAARSWNEMRLAIYAHERIWIAPRGSASSYRICGRAGDYGRGRFGTQHYFWEQLGSPWAARPCTSNHGLGRAVDAKTKAMRTAIDRHGSRYRWHFPISYEWWHAEYRGGYVWPLAPLHPDERSRVMEYRVLTLKRTTPRRREWLRAWMRSRRKGVELAGKRHGFDRQDRRVRWHTLRLYGGAYRIPNWPR